AGLLKACLVLIFRETRPYLALVCLAYLRRVLRLLDRSYGSLRGRAVGEEPLHLVLERVRCLKAHIPHCKTAVRVHQVDDGLEGRRCLGRIEPDSRRNADLFQIRLLVCLRSNVTNPEEVRLLLLAPGRETEC